MPEVTVVMLAWGEEPVLEDAVRACLASVDEHGAPLGVEVVLVDNGCLGGGVDTVRSMAGVSLVEPGDNLGFAGGCNLGATRARGEYVAFVNSDAVPEPVALGRLVAALHADDVGLATASVRLADRPELINSAGNPVHFTGLSWAGGMGRPASDFASSRDVASASGAATAVRLDRFRDLGGFCETMFAYCEDTELSLRSWQRGWRVVYVPDAVVLHHYEFSRNARKLYLLERNRLFLVLTVFGPGQLLCALPPILALEAATLALALRDGWARQKLAGWWWLLRHAGVVRARRREVRGRRTVPDRRVSAMITGDLDPGVEGLSVPRIAQRGSQAYWAIARRVA